MFATWDHGGWGTFPPQSQGKGGLSSLKVTRMTCPLRGVWAGLLPHLLPSSIVPEARGGGVPQRGTPALKDGLRMHERSHRTRESGGPISRILIFPTVLRVGTIIIRPWACVGFATLQGVAPQPDLI